jgi:Cu(I)/Ag(I) efflux system membrane fusion protein
MSATDLIRRHRRWLAIGIGVGIALVLLRGRLVPEEPMPPPLPTEAVRDIQTAFESYEEIRALLARDAIDGLEPRAHAVAASLESAAAQLAEGAPELSEIALSGVAAAHRLASSSDLDQARSEFAALSRAVVSLGTEEPRLAEGWHLFSCPMVDGFNRWIQRSETLENPYMGTRMPRCGVPEPWRETAGRGADRGHEHSDDAISHYTCSMHPSVQADEPGSCPICGMQLVAVTREEVETGVILIDEQRRQRVGVRTATAKSRPVSVTVRTIGQIDYDETRLADVTLKVSGWIVHLEVDETGQRVEKGETLFTLYSPELYAAQQEYLLALESRRAAQETGAPDRADYLVRAAENRLRLWDLTESQIRGIASRGQPSEAIPILSPVSGYVTEKSVVEGASVGAGDRLYRIAELESVWVNTQIYEMDLPLVRVGQPAQVILPYHPGRVFEGRVSYVYPYLESGTRTGRLRIELENPELELRPDMYANVELTVDLGERLTVPESAVVYTGPRRLVFLDLGEGRLRPQEVELGIRSDESYEVLSGIREGDRVVTSGNFLVSAESRIRSAARYWGGEHAQH